MEHNNNNNKRSQHRSFNRLNNLVKETNQSKRVYRYNYNRNNNQEDLEHNQSYYYQKKIDDNDLSEVEFYQNIDLYFDKIEEENSIKIYFPKLIRIAEYNSHKTLVLENLLHKFINPMEMEINLSYPYQFKKPYISRTSFRIDFQDQIERILKLYFESDTQGKIIIAIIDRLVMLYNSLKNNSIWNHLDLDMANPRLLIIYENENNNGTYLKILVKLVSFSGANFNLDVKPDTTYNNINNINKNYNKKNEILKGIKSLICHLINFYYFKFFLDG